ncbi:MAG: porin [Alphaproteobacteria bacterium]|nr:porin [Alphaproteobacteria bacterium]
MKKYYTAAVLSLLSLPVYAGEFVYDYSAVVDGFYGYTQYADKYRHLYQRNNTPVSAEISTSIGYEFTNNQKISLGFDAQAAHGKEIKDYNHGDWGENLYLSYAFGYGELSVGQIYNAAYQMAVGAPTVGYFRVNNTPMTDFISNPNWQRKGKITSYRTLNSTYLNTDADAFKISYTTEEFYNTKLAVSYTPDSYSEAGLINKHSRYDNRSSYAVGLYNNLDLDFVEVESSLGYAYNRKNNQEISAGLSLYRKGWTLGGSYRKSFTTSGDYALNITDKENMPYYFDGYRRGQAFNVGLSYEIGPFKTGLSYFAAYADKTNNRDSVVSWVNRFAFNKYVSIYLATSYAEYKGDKVIDESNRGYAAVGGLELSF